MPEARGDALAQRQSCLHRVKVILTSLKPLKGQTIYTQLLRGELNWTKTSYSRGTCNSVYIKLLSIHGFSVSLDLWLSPMYEWKCMYNDPLGRHSKADSVI